MMPTIITYLLMTTYYAFFWLALFASSKNDSGKLKDVLSGKGDFGSLLISLVAGIFFLGLGTAVVFDRKQLDPNVIGPVWNWSYATAVLVVLSSFLGIYSALRKSNNNEVAHCLPPHLPLSFLAIRVLFLIVYEFFFRGAMLFTAIDDLGIPIAIAFNLLFYVLAHWFDKQEKYGSLIMGTLLCIITIYNNSVWPAIFIHISLALSYEITLLIKYKSLIKKSFV